MGKKDDEKCGNCRFFGQKGDGSYGLCLRYPPTVVDEDTDVFPGVGKGDWCGEWRKSNAD